MKEAKLYIAPTKGDISTTLFSLIHKSLQFALDKSPQFYIALSGGSLPSLLSDLPQSFTDANIDPHWENWHIVLADERLVPSSDPDSNLKALRESFLNQVPIPPEQIYGIDESQLSSGTLVHENIAKEYQNRVFDEGVCKTRNKEHLVDCVLLGFGPDGHTASLFPNHALLNETQLLVAGIQDSPKPPLERITLSMKVFNEQSRYVIFVGAGESKAPILKDIFEQIHVTSDDGNSKQCVVEMKEVSEQQYPCGMIRPRDGGLVYITDSAGGKDLMFAQSCCSLL
jgi:6-phosphogluconolactonase